MKFGVLGEQLRLHLECNFQRIRIEQFLANVTLPTNTSGSISTTFPARKPPTFYTR